MKTETIRTIDGMFFILLCLVLIMTIPWHEGIGPCDPTSYVLGLKKFFTTNPIDHNSLFGMRFVARLPYAVYVFLFGVNKYITWTTTVEFCILLCAIYYSLRKYDQLIAFYSVALLGFSTFMITEATVVMGDILLTLLVNVPILIYWRCIKNEDNPKPFLWGTIAGICWVLAFYTKESAVYYLVLCGCFAIVAGYKKLKHDIKFWSSFWVIVTAAGIGSAYYFYSKTGDPFYQIRMVDKVIDPDAVFSVQSVWKAGKQLPYRLTLQPVTFFIRDYTMGILALISILYLNPFKKSQNGFWKWYFLIILVVWWFFPQKLNPYYPMWLLYRLWLPLMVPLAICAGHGVKILISRQETKSDRIIMIAAVFFFAVMSYIFFMMYGDVPHLERAVFYGIVLVVIVTTFYVHENDISPILRKAIMLSLLLIIFILHENNITLILFVLTFLVYESNRLPNLRKMTFVVMLLPFFYNHYNRFLWRDANKSEYDNAVELMNHLETKNPRIVFMSGCLTRFYKLYDNQKLHLVSYEDTVVKSDTLHDAYLVIDKKLMDAKYHSKDNEFTEVISVPYIVETNPSEIGFELVEDGATYQIYYHK